MQNHHYLSNLRLLLRCTLVPSCNSLNWVRPLENKINLVKRSGRAMFVWSLSLLVMWVIRLSETVVIKVLHHWLQIWYSCHTLPVSESRASSEQSNFRWSCPLSSYRPALSHNYKISSIMYSYLKKLWWQTQDFHSSLQADRERLVKPITSWCS